MGKIKNLGGQWIQVGDSAMNLNSFKNISKGYFGLDEDPDGNQYCIEVIEKDLIDGEERKYMIALYQESERDIWDEDFQNILDSLSSDRG